MILDFKISPKMNGHSEARMAENAKSGVFFLRATKVVRCSNYYFLEINTLPGMTNTSLLPIAAKSANITFRELVKTIIDLGLNKDELMELDLSQLTKITKKKYHTKLGFPQISEFIFCTIISQILLFSPIILLIIGLKFF